MGTLKAKGKILFITVKEFFEREKPGGGNHRLAQATPRHVPQIS